LLVQEQCGATVPHPGKNEQEDYRHKVLRACKNSPIRWFCNRKFTRFAGSITELLSDKKDAAVAIALMRCGDRKFGGFGFFSKKPCVLRTG
jgi:hypothetical protein